MKLPEYLYKYESFSTQSLENLQAGIIYFGSPKNFNDPYDCATPVGILDPTNDDVEYVRQILIDRMKNDESSVEIIKNDSVEILKERLLNSAELILDNLAKYVIPNAGITCFSEKKDNLLMWSHYGGRNKGYCLEFPTTIEPFHKAMKVEYGTKFPYLTIRDIYDFTQKVETSIFLKKYFGYKSKDWQYEKEWRCIHLETGVQYSYRPECLTGIYLGPDMNRESKEIIRAILKEQNKTVKIWQGKRSQKQFKVLFELLD